MIKKPPEGDAGDKSLIPGWRISPREENGNLLQYSCLENSMDRGAWWATAHGVEKRGTRLSAHTHTHTHSDTNSKDQALGTQNCIWHSPHSQEQPASLERHSALFIYLFGILL